MLPPAKPRGPPFNARLVKDGITSLLLRRVAPAPTCWRVMSLGADRLKVDNGPFSR